MELDRGRQIAASRLFGPTELVGVAWERSYAAAEYVQLMLTQSDHRLLEADRRARLLGAIFDLIERAGGRYRVGYVTLLYLTRALR